MNLHAQDEENVPNFGLIRPRVASPTRRSDDTTPAPAAPHRDGGSQRRQLSFKEDHVQRSPLNAASKNWLHWPVARQPSCQRAAWHALYSGGLQQCDYM